MKLFKKISTILGSALMIGATVGIAAAASFPAPFIQNGAADVAIVVGGNAAPSDWIASTNVYSKLSSTLSGQTATSTTTAAGVSGEGVNLGTSSRKIYYNDALSAGRGSLSYTELGTVLADGTFTDLSGTEYDYTQTVKLGYAGNVTFGTSGSDINDPTIYLDAGTTAGNLYNYTLGFNKNLNVSDPTNVQGQKIKILGIDYVIGASSTASTIYLYGAGETVTVNGGEETTATIGGTPHTVELVTTSSTTAGTIKVDGVSKSVTEGSSYTYAGDITVYVKDIIHPAYAGDLRQAELIIGSNKLQLTSGSAVKIGADATTIKGTLATITSSGNLVSKIDIGIAKDKTKTDHIGVGESFTDPVFGGLKVSFAGGVPALDSTARGKVVVETDNSQYAYVTFTSAKAGSAGEQKITYVYDNNTASTAVKPVLAGKNLPTTTGKGVIHVLEGEAAQEGDFIVINQGDAGTMLEVTTISVDSETLGSVTFTDVITGVEKNIPLTNVAGAGGGLQKTGLNEFGGNGYTVVINPATNTSVNVSWNTGTLAVFPRIKLAGGGWIALLKSQNLTNASSYIFPDGLTTLATTGTTVDNDITNIVKHVNGVSWGFQQNDGSTANATQVKNITGGTQCNFNSTLGPAILFLEPKKWDDSSYGNFICVPLKTSGTTEIGIEDAVINGSNSGYESQTTDSNIKQAVNKYGTLVTKEDATNENGKVTISYPSSQAYYDILFAAESATITPGSSSSGSSAELGAITVKDTDVGTESGKNLIVIGGSCINSVAAELVGSAACEADFTTATGINAGEAIIRSYDKGGKVALLVAGYNAADTMKAVTYLVNNMVDTTVGKALKVTSTTEATAITESA